MDIEELSDTLESSECGGTLRPSAGAVKRYFGSPTVHTHQNSSWVTCPLVVESAPVSNIPARKYCRPRAMPCCEGKAGSRPSWL